MYCLLLGYFKKGADSFEKNQYKYIVFHTKKNPAKCYCIIIFFIKALLANKLWVKNSPAIKNIDICQCFFKHFQHFKVEILAFIYEMFLTCVPIWKSLNKKA